MKNKLRILIGIFIFSHFIFSYTCIKTGYLKKRNEIFYNDGFELKQLSKVDANTFKQIYSFIGRDKNHVYYVGEILKNIDTKTFEVVSKYIPIPDDPVWGIGCQISYITEFKDKNGTYSLEDIQNGKLELE